MNYEVVIGLEVHAELNTETKIYCGCRNVFGAPPNTNCCPVCTGMPGALPVLNRKAVESAIRMGLALHCRINRLSKQDRKNYFYPDLPKAYQISQYDIPLCENGYLEILTKEGTSSKKIGITRIHIEEDAGKLIHSDEYGTLIDYNRCGVPLIEIVTEPDLRSSAEAKAFFDTVKTTLLYLGISDCRMQEGSLRCDVNVSVRPMGSTEYGTRVEMKNVNSFSAAVRAIDYEAARQIKLLQAGETILQETRRWDDGAGKNVLLRSKEDAEDYRYFPEPDLGVIALKEQQLDALQSSIPELPTEKLQRLMQQYSLPYQDAALLCETREKAEFLEQTAAYGQNPPKQIANWVLGDITRILNEREITLAETALTPAKLSEMLALIEDGTLSNTSAKTVLEAILFENATAADVMDAKGLRQVNDSDLLGEIVTEVLSLHQSAIADYRNGKSNALGFLVGQCMRRSQGKGNPVLLRQMLLKQLEP